MGVFLKELNEIYRGISSHQVRVGIIEISSDQLISGKRERFTRTRNEKRRIFCREIDESVWIYSVLSLLYMKLIAKIFQALPSGPSSKKIKPDGS